MQTFSENSSDTALLARLDKVFYECFKLPAGASDALTTNDVDLWDSLRHMELIVAIEQEFNFALTFDEISSMQNIGAIRELIVSKSSV